MLGEISTVAAVMLLVVVVGVTAGVVVMTMASRKIPVQIPRKVMGRGRIREGQKSFIPIRVNSAGVMPIIFAQSFIIIPGTATALFPSDFMQTVADLFQPGLIYYITYGILIVFFTYFYTAIQFDPERQADMIQRQGGFIPGIRPGRATVNYLSYVLSRITLPGALYLAVVTILPSLFGWWWGVPVGLSGVSIIIVAGVALETTKQIESQLTMRNYEGFLS